MQVRFEVIQGVGVTTILARSGSWSHTALRQVSTTIPLITVAYSAS